MVRLVASLTAQRGFPPSIRELSDGWGGESTNGIFNHLKACERKGLLTKVPGVARSLVITSKGKALL